MLQPKVTEHDFSWTGKHILKTCDAKEEAIESGGYVHTAPIQYLFITGPPAITISNNYLAYITHAAVQSILLLKESNLINVLELSAI